ncbi:MAG TPA: ABC transporter ATP-binding protein [Pirellulales bacterium]|nr:ABC transporter ATP-binding protein [Pirellulales bacterium]
MIEFQDVARTYGQKLAVAGLNLKIPRGQRFALLGPNGAGKTTTIKMLVGLLQPSTGIVRVCGHDVVRKSREASRFVGFVPDEVFLYEKLSGREFLEFVADLHGLNRRDAAARIAAHIDAFELAAFIDGRSETYSHGMKQRLALAAALVHEPAVLVLDEPMVGLDPRSMRLVKNLLQQRTAAGMSVFMSTHSLSLAEEIADLIGIVDGGRLKFFGTLAELRGQAAHGHTSLEELYLGLTTADADRQAALSAAPAATIAVAPTVATAGKNGCEAASGEGEAR